MTFSAHNERPDMPREDFIAAISRQYGAVYMTALALCRNGDMASDVTQETFLRAWMNLKNLNTPAQLTPWLHAIARNTARQWMRDGQNRSRLLPLIPLEDVPMEPANHDQPSPRDQVATREEARQLQAMLAELPEEMRGAILYHYAEGMTATQIAEITGEAVSTVTRRLEKARGLLRNKLEELWRPAFGQMRAPAQGAAKTGALIIAAAGLSATAQAQLMTMAGGTALPVPASVGIAGAAATEAVVASGSKSVFLSQIIQGTVMTTTTKIIAGLMITGGAILAMRSLTKVGDDGRSRQMNRQEMPVASSPNTKVKTVTKNRSDQATGKQNDSASSRTTQRLDPKTRMAAWKDDVVSSSPQLVKRDGETTGRIYFNVTVVNESGLPVPNAKVEMTGLRRRVEMASWYGFGGEKCIEVTNEQGMARVWAPQFVEEQLETGGVTLNVSHPDYTDSHANLMFEKMTRVILKTGERFQVIVSDDKSSSPLKSGVKLVFSHPQPEWSQRSDGIFDVWKVQESIYGKFHLYGTYNPDANSTASSEIVHFKLPVDPKEPIHLTVYPTYTVLGRLSENVQRPVRNGKVSAYHATLDKGRIYHSLQTVDVHPDGTFELKGLPFGLTQVWGLASGWSSVVPDPSQSLIYKDYRLRQGEKRPIMGEPQNFLIREDQQHYELPMEQTATVIFTLQDDHGNAVQGNRVMTSPNMCTEYGCGLWMQDESSLSTTSTVSGTAVISNLPPLAKSRFSVYGDYELPPRPNPNNPDQIDRNFVADLYPGQVLEQTLTVYPQGTTMITQTGDKMTTSTIEP